MISRADFLRLFRKHLIVASYRLTLTSSKRSLAHETITRVHDHMCPFGAVLQRRIVKRLSVKGKDDYALTVDHYWRWVASRVLYLQMTEIVANVLLEDKAEVE